LKANSRALNLIFFLWIDTKSIALTGKRKLELLDVPKPDLSNNDDVLLKVCSVGICGSDIHYYLEGGIGDTVVEYPFVIGHELWLWLIEPVTVLIT